MRIIPRVPLFAALAFAAVAVLPHAASAGVATSGAVLLDPYDPVPEIQFHHFGGYGCVSGCGAYYAGYDRCDPCHRRYHRRHDYDRDHDCRDDCDRGDDDRDARQEHEAVENTCTSAHCYDAEHYERRWRDGDRIGQEWEDRGHREKVLPDGGGPGNFYGREYDWHDDDAGPPPPVVVDDHHDGDHHDGDHHDDHHDHH